MKKTIITVSTGFMLAFGSLSLPVTEEALAREVTQSIEEAQVASTVNFRAAPSTSSRVMGTLPKGKTIQVLEEVNRYWLKVSAYGITGYVSSDYVSYSSGQADTRKEKDTSSSSEVESSSQLADKIIQTGLKYRGTRYKFGARTGNTSSFDCSSFTQYIFGVNDVEIPRNSRQQATVGTTIYSKSELQKGDLIFFKTGNRPDGRIDHVAVYMGDGKIIHSIPSGGVQIDRLSGYWMETAVGAKRVLNK
jgi:cell wall-associated NlpC family hydrolase